MRPSTPSSLVKHYPLAIGLFVLLLPYFYRLLIFPFTFRNSVSTHEAGDVEVSTSSTISTSTFSSLSTSSSASSSGKGGYYFWKAFRGPKSEGQDDKEKESRTTSVSTKKQQTKKGPPAPVPTSIKFSTIKSTKTVTKSYTKSVTKSVTKSITKSVTETIQLTLEKEVEPSVKVRAPQEADNVVVIEEIDSMGWHQVHPTYTPTDH
jgi:hypothetical protein